MPVLELIRKSVPPPENSPDFSEEAAAAALVTTTSQEFVHKLEEVILSEERPNVGGAIKHDLRRWGEYLYCRTTILLPGEPDKVLVFRLDWLTNEAVSA